MSSTTGTTTRTRRGKSDEQSFTAADLCEIIKAAQSTQLKKLSYRGLELRFFGPAGAEERPAYGDFFVSQLPETPGTQEVVHSLEQKAILDDLALTQLAIDDPLAYEQSMIDEQLGLNKD